MTPKRLHDFIISHLRDDRVVVVLVFVGGFDVDLPTVILLLRFEYLGPEIKSIFAVGILRPLNTDLFEPVDSFRLRFRIRSSKSWVALLPIPERLGPDD